MKASDLINLTIIDRIFEERTDMELKPITKMLYINVLTYHFKQKEATEKNMSAFEMFKDDLQFDKFQKHYQELHSSGLIAIGNVSILFNNVWGMYIDKSLFDKKDSDNTVISFKDQLKTYDQVIDMVAMRHKIHKEKVMLFMDVFILEQGALNTRYENLSECVRHFFNWSNINIPKSNPSSKQTKILGLE